MRSLLIFCFFVLIFTLPVRAQQSTPLLSKAELDAQKVFSDLQEALAQADTVYVLNLGKQALKEVPKEVFQLKKLQVLYLYQNELSELPTEIAQLKNLEYLDLYANQLSRLPKEISQLTHLKRLDLGNNRFIQIPPEISTLTALEAFFIYNNRLKTLSENTFEGNQNLRFLRMSNTRLKNLPENIGTLPRIEELHLADNGLRELPSSFGRYKSLRRLDLNYNRFGRIPPPVFELSDSLQVLMLWDRGFVEKEREAWESAMPQTRLVGETLYEGYLWGLTAGLSQGQNTVLELGAARAFRKDFLMVAAGISGEYALDGKSGGIKASLWLNALAATGLHLLYYQNENGSAFGVRPEIGFGLGHWSLLYGYNFLFGEGRQGINSHQVGIRVLLPFAPAYGVFK